MPPPKFPQLPFLTREMLKFGGEITLDLEVVTWSQRSDNIDLIGLTREGIFKFDITHDAGGGKNNKVFRVPDVPISLTLSTDSVSSHRGEFYAIVYLRVNQERVYQLCSGYVTPHTAVTFPQTHSAPETSERGRIKSVIVTNPSAGADWKGDITSDKIWRLVAIVAKLVTDANAADRRVHLQLGLGTSTEASMIDLFGSIEHPASTTRKYTFAPLGAIADGEDDDDILINIPKDLIFDGASDIQTETTNIQVGDQWSAIILHVEEWIQD